MNLIDTHCHIHDSEFEFLSGDVYDRAKDAGVTKMVCVGTSVRASHEAAEFASTKDDCYFSLALHPHEAGSMSQDILEQAWVSLEKLAHSVKGDSSFVAIGECGLDFYYHDSAEVIERQKWLLHKHLQLAAELNKPVIFHIREAFDAFWPVYEEYGTAGVIHSFSGGLKDAQGILGRSNLYVGLNGIMTFTKNEDQLAAAQSIPLDRLVLETDAPYLTPTPLRGTINEPKNVFLVAQFLSDLRKEPEELLIDQTTKNAEKLFGL